MKSFFKIFFATLFALVVFTGIVFWLSKSFVDKAIEPEKPVRQDNTILVFDLSKPIMEQTTEAGIPMPQSNNTAMNGLFDVVRAIKFAKTDVKVKGLYLKCSGNPNGFATSEELRNALIDFKQSKKFVFAYANEISQKAFYVANVADKLYCNPQGMLDWKGFSMQQTYFKGLLEKLEIQPEIFYAGQFKSATEPFREKQMTPANRLQSTIFLNELYGMFLQSATQKSGMDTGSLHALSNNYAVRSAYDALRYKLVDGLKYDDEVKDEMQAKAGIAKGEDIPLMPMADYIKAIDWSSSSKLNKIAVIYAQGDIVDGKGEDNEIGGDKFMELLRKARLDSSIKAVVLRINSGGGSAMASEQIWREVTLIRKAKPVIVSMGDYAASGGYYIACNADSIFAQPNTLTGSIGVFSLYGNVSGLMTNKLGITFDGVKTSPMADFPNTFRPMTELERNVAQSGVDSIYLTFKTRVSQGRHIPINVVDSIAQGRIWSGRQGLQIKLVDKIGGIQDAIDCAARMAKLQAYSLYEWPQVPSFWQKIFKSKDNTAIGEAMVQQEIGEVHLKYLQQMKQIKSWFGAPQTRLPFFMDIR